MMSRIRALATTAAGGIILDVRTDGCFSLGIAISWGFIALASMRTASMELDETSARDQTLVAGLPGGTDAVLAG